MEHWYLLWSLGRCLITLDSCILGSSAICQQSIWWSLLHWCCQLLDCLLLLLDQSRSWQLGPFILRGCGRYYLCSENLHFHHCQHLRDVCNSWFLRLQNVPLRMQKWLHLRQFGSLLGKYLNPINHSLRSTRIRFPLLQPTFRWNLHNQILAIMVFISWSQRLYHLSLCSRINYHYWFKRKDKLWHFYRLQQFK